MIDPAIQKFLNERKELWLNKKIKSKTTEEEKADFTKQASEKFALESWLPDAAKRAKQLSLVSHPGKFSHPSAKTTSIIAEAPRGNDGFMRTGNVNVDLDVLGNAAALDVYKFLSVKLADGKTILSHLEDNTTPIEDQFTFASISFEEIKQGLLAIKQDDDSLVKTSGKVKQVYFPVAQGDYHLLSVLTPSNIMYKLKERINIMHFSDEAKEARGAKKANKSHGTALSEVYGLSVIGYGGTKPQNISVLNSQNGGAAYLLPSLPPELSPRKVQPPRVNFFTNSLWPKAFTKDFQKFHKLLVADTNNIHIRAQRDWQIRAIIYQVVDRMWMIRSLDSGWSDRDHFQSLPYVQKIWLDQQYSGERNDNSQWFPVIQKELARWFRNTYAKLLAQKALALGDNELPHIQKIIAECEEALR